MIVLVGMLGPSLTAFRFCILILFDYYQVVQIPDCSATASGALLCIILLFMTYA